LYAVCNESSFPKNATELSDCPYIDENKDENGDEENGFGDQIGDSIVGGIIKVTDIICAPIEWLTNKLMLLYMKE
jgi:hypothetical protein